MYRKHINFKKDIIDYEYKFYFFIMFVMFSN